MKWYKITSKIIAACAATFTNILSQHTTVLYFIILITHNFGWHNCKPPEDGVQGYSKWLSGF